MSKRDCQKKNKETVDDDGSTVDATAAKKPIKDGLLITTVTTMATGIFFGLKTVCLGQHGALLTSASFVYFVSFFRPREARSGGEKSYTINE